MTKIFVPRAVRDATLVANRLLAKPANFAITFLAQGASLKPRSVALAVANGVLATGPSLSMYLPTGQILSWKQAAILARAFSKRFGRFESQLYRKMEEELAFRKFKRALPSILRKAKKVSAMKMAAYKRIAAETAARKAAAAATLESRRAAQSTNKSAFRRGLKLKNLRSKRTCSTTPKELSLGDIFPFSSSLFPKATKLVVKSGTPDFHSLSSRYEDEVEFVPPVVAPLIGSYIQSLPLMGEILSLALPLSKIYSLLSVQGAYSFLEHVNALSSSSTIMERVVFLESLRLFIEVNQLSSGCLLNEYAHFFVLATCQELRELNANLHLTLLAMKECGTTSQLQGFWQFVLNAGKVAKDFVVNKAKNSLEWVLNQCKETFFSCISGYLAKAQHYKAEIEKFWNCCVTWATNMWTRTHLAIQALGVYAIWALVVVILCGITYLAESLLMACGVLATHGILVALLLTGFMGIMGYTIFTLGAESAALLSAIRQAILISVIPDPEREREQAVSNEETLLQSSFLDTVMAPINFLNLVANSLTNFSTGSITVLGKLGNSLDGIRKGFNCLGEFCSLFLDGCSQVWETISGKKSAFFRDLAKVVQIDLDKWVKDARQLIEYHEMCGTLDKYEFERVRTLIYRGEKLMDTSSRARASATCNKFQRTISGLVSDLRKIRENSRNSLRFDGWRLCPFWVYIHGESQCGKSTLANYLAPTLLKHLGCEPDDTYGKDPVDQYWQNYFQQKCVKLNDLSATECVANVPIEQQLIQLISTEEKTVSGADIAGKAVQFDSDIIISSSNVADAPTGANILDGNAYRLRRKVVLECRRACEYIINDDGSRTEMVDPKDPSKLVLRPYIASDALACTEIRWKHNSTGVQLPGSRGQWHLARDSFPALFEEMDTHFAKEKELKASWRENMGTQSKTARGITSYLRNLTQLLSTEKRNENCSTSDDVSVSLVAIDGNFYRLDSGGVLTKAPKNISSDYEAVESITTSQFYMNFLNKIDHTLMSSINEDFHVSMIKDVINGMLENEACVLSVDKISSSSAAMHRDLWEELGLTERFFLRVAQVVLNRVRAQDHFTSNPTSIFLDYMGSCRDKVVAHKEQLLFFFCALTMIGIAGAAFWALYKVFISGTLGIGAGMALKAQLDLQSVHSSGSVVSAFAQSSRPLVWSAASSISNFQSSSQSFDLFNDGLGFLLVRVVGASGISETGMLYASNTIAMGIHQMKQFADGERVVIHYFGKDRSAKCFVFTWRWGDIFETDNCEIGQYCSGQLTPLPSYPDNLYIRGDERIANTVNINGVGIKYKKHFPADQLDPADSVLADDVPLVRSFSALASTCNKVHTFACLTGGLTYKRSLKSYMTSNYKSSNFDCGTIISTVVAGKRKVVGMHISGQQTGLVNLTFIGFLPPATISTFQSGDFFEPSSGVIEEGYEKIGFISDPSKRPRSGKTSQIASVPEEMKIEVPEGVILKVPSVLSRSDPILSLEENLQFVNYDPLKDGMQKFQTPIALLDEDKLSAVCDDIFESWFDCLPTLEGEKILLEKTTLDIALNGIDGVDFCDAMRLDTSEGYPHTLERLPGQKGKERYVEVDDFNHRTLIPNTSVSNSYEALSASIFEQVPVLNCVECPKDECLKPSKVPGGTRLFDTLPFEHNILLREYFLNFCIFLQSNRGSLPTQVGVNPYSREWTHIFGRLASKSDKGLNCDYSKFDGLISHQIYSHMVATINRLFKDGGRNNCARRNLFLMFVGRRSIAFDQVYLVRGGMPSGCALTVIINSVFNEILMRYTYREFVPAPSRDYFSKYVSLVVYGDDNLLTIDSSVESFFNGNIIKDFLKTKNVVITDGADKSASSLEFRPLQSLEFLKRGFRKTNTGRQSAPLDKNSLYTRLRYTTKGPDGAYQLDILHDNVKSFLEELVLHDEHVFEFNRVRNFYVGKIPTWSQSLPTYATCVRVMEAHQTGALAYEPHKFLCTKIDNRGVKMMSGQGKIDHCIYVTDRLGVCGLQFETTSPNAFFVSTEGLKPGIPGVQVPIVGGDRDMPTSAWISQFSSPKKQKVIFDAYNEGKTIYFRSRMPFIFGWCALIKFAKAQHINSDGLLALYQKYKPAASGDIAPLLAEPIFRKCYNTPLFTQLVRDADAS